MSISKSNKKSKKEVIDVVDTGAETIDIAEVTDVNIGDVIEVLVSNEVDIIPEVVVLTSEEVAKKNAKLSRMYFNQNTQAAIVAYQGSDNKKQRDMLYEMEIYPAFEKLAENLINIHKFTSLHDTYDDLKNDCVNFLFETIRKFDATRGTNAFSYFNVVAKNWLIIKTKQKAQRIKRSVSFDDPNALNSNELKIIEEHCTIHSSELSFENDSDNIIGLLYEIRSKVKSENELACINSIITVFENIDDVDLLNKSAILLYMRELSGLSPKQLTTTMQIVKKHYRKLKVESRYNLF